MRIKSFTLSQAQTRCKFLLLAAMAFMLYVPQVHAQTVNILQQGFEQPLFPPPGGWSDSTYTPATNPTGYPSWTRYTGIGTVGFLPYPGPYQTSGFTPHAGTHGTMGYALFNSHLVDSGTIAELATPPINFSTLATIGGQYTLSFWVYNKYVGSHDSNVIYVYINQNVPFSNFGGVKIDSIYPQSNASLSGWVQYTLPLSQTYNTYTGAYIIFKAIDSVVNVTAPPATVAGQYDMGLDDISIDFTPPCTGVPNGSVNHPSPCKNVPFKLSYNDTVHTNLTYGWYSSTDSITWSGVLGANPTFTTSQASDTMYYRLVVHCGISNTYDTINMNSILLPFYKCYCSDTSGNNHNINIGNVTMATYPSNGVVLNNGNPYPIVNNSSAVHNYTSYTYLTPANMYIDSVFSLFVTGISSGSYPTGSGYKVSAYIDYNHDGVFDPITERVMNSLPTAAGGVSQSNPTAADTFSINKAIAQFGLTGMRVIIDNSVSTNGPCGSPIAYSNGETEDYVVNIIHDQCNGNANPGTAYITSTTMCPGYTFTIGDSTHDKNIFGIQYNWQSSPDNGVTWGNMPFVLNQDKLTIAYVNPESYRLQMVCTNAHDTTYSNVVSVGGEPSYACYCVSQAIGGDANDSTDIGAFILGKYYYTKNNSSNNGHVNNPDATHGRSDYTTHIMDLGIDSTYDFLIYQIMHRAYHSDAKITIFIDFNNNLKYDYPDDAVLTLYTTPDSFFVSSTLTIQPHYYTVPNVLTGMRLIINSDTLANTASDQGCGSYVSGETVDFVVRLHDSTTAGINRIKNLSDVAIFPNPTSGKFKVMFNAASNVTHLDLNVTNVTGQRVMIKSYDNVGTQFATELDLSGQPRGIYFIEFMVDGERMIKKLSIE